VNEQLGEQRLSKPLALCVLSPDGISSSAYGTEEILTESVPTVGIAAFTLNPPLTLVILFIMTLVLLSYREVAMVYIRPGGSYVVTGRARSGAAGRDQGRDHAGADRAAEAGVDRLALPRKRLALWRGEAREVGHRAEGVVEFAGRLLDELRH
jgi:amino acid transporter